MLQSFGQGRVSPVSGAFACSGESAANVTAGDGLCLPFELFPCRNEFFRYVVGRINSPLQGGAAQFVIEPFSCRDHALHAELIQHKSAATRRNLGAAWFIGERLQ